MGTREGYAAGTFCWVDVGTTDVDAAKRFYGELFGWEPRDFPAAPGMTYTRCVIGDRDVAAIYGQGERGRAAGLPPQWSSYVAVDDVDAVAARAAELGATLVAEPFDVLDAGRMAVIRDPVGAHVSLWQAGSHPGAGLVNDIGCWSSNQLQAPDPALAVPFYSDLLGWEIEAEQGSDIPYWSIRNDGADNGGMVATPGPPAWVVYFHVADADATGAAVADSGGGVLFPPTTVAAAGSPCSPTRRARRSASSRARPIPDPLSASCARAASSSSPSRPRAAAARARPSSTARAGSPCAPCASTAASS
jgi:uncharacterized protein